MSLFGHDEPEEFLLFVQNFNMTLAIIGTHEMDAKIQYLRMLVHGGALHQFNLLSSGMENNDTSLSVDYLIKGLAWYFPPVNFLSKQKRTIHHCMKKTRSLRVRRYAARLIDLN